MIAYYRDEDGNVYDWQHDGAVSPRALLVNGRIAKFIRASDNGRGREKAADAWVKHWSMAMAINPDDEAEHIQACIDKGISPPKMDELGRMGFRSREEQLRYCKAFEVVNRDDYR